MRILPALLLAVCAFAQPHVVTTLPATCPDVGAQYELTDSGAANGFYHCPVQGVPPVQGSGAGTPGPTGPTGPAGADGAAGPQAVVPFRHDSSKRL